MPPVTEKKSLRIGLVRGGKIIQERLVREREPVSIGLSAKNTFSVPEAKGLPESFTLFPMKGDQYQLAFTDKMGGRLQVESNNIELAALKNQGLAAKDGDANVVPLTDSSRGKIDIGDVSILFQFVTPPPEMPKAVIPPSAQNYWLKNIDLMYVGVMLGSFVLHFGTILYLSTLPIPKMVALDQIPDRFRSVLAPKEEKKEEPPPQENKDQPAEELAAEKEDAPEEKPSQAAPSGQAMSTTRRDAIRKEAAGMGIVALLTAEGAGGGAIADVFKEGNVGGDLDKIMGGIGGIGLATSADLKTTVGGGDGGGAATIDSLGTQKIEKKGATLTRTGANVTGTLKISTPAIDGELDPNAVSSVVRQNQLAIKACYEGELKRNPSLKGRIEVMILIDSLGRVAKVEVASNTMGNREVADCMQSRIRRWRFPKPKGGDVEVKYPFIFSPSS